MHRDGTTTMIMAATAITAITAAAEFSIALRTTSIFAVARLTPIPACGSCASGASRRASTGALGVMTNAGSGWTEAAVPILKSVADATVVTGTGNEVLERSAHPVLLGAAKPSFSAKVWRR